MKMDDSELVADIVLPAVKKCSLVFIAWVASIVGSIYTAGIAHVAFVTLFYILSIAIYFVVVRFDRAMENAGEFVGNKTQGAFWFLFNIVTAVAIHYLFFWGGNAI